MCPSGQFGSRVTAEGFYYIFYQLEDIRGRVKLRAHGKNISSLTDVRKHPWKYRTILPRARIFIAQAFIIRGKDATITTVQEFLDFGVVVGNIIGLAHIRNMGRYLQAKIFHGSNLPLVA
jgi:hypothetical protein